MIPAAARVISGSVYVAVGVTIAALAAWPIYRSMAFVLLVLVAVAAAAVIAAVATVRRWNGWVVAAALTASFVLLAVPLAVPGRLGSVADVLAGLGEAGAGAVVGWKDLLTVTLPVGTYRNLLVPALVVFLVGTCAGLLLAWRTDRKAAGAVAVMWTMAAFGLLFGSSVVSAALAVGPVRIAAPIETGLGLASLASGLLWIAWRGRAARVSALRRADVEAGSRVRRSHRARTNPAVAVGMLALAVVAGATATTAVSAAETDRQVLRGTAGPELLVAEQVSPLATYRSWFADDAFDEVLFTVSGDALPDRIRLAVLDDYDGTTYRTSSAPSGVFARVPTASGSAADPITVEIAAWSSIWMPVPGALAAAEFQGDRARTLSEGFYYNASLQAAVQAVAWQPGDRVRMQAMPAVESLALAASEPFEGGVPSVRSDVPAPPALTQWMQQNSVDSALPAGAELERLIGLMREQGYLSHALDDTGAQWQGEWPDYEFVPAAAGHSLGRIDALFTALLDGGRTTAAAGDDEQFAVAASLVARELGFTSRVVLGARLTEPAPNAAAATGGALSICDDQICRGSDISAWLEVQASDGGWIAVDVTPQHERTPAPETTNRSDPQVATEVDPDNISEVSPPESRQDDNLRDLGDDESGQSGSVWAAVGIAAASTFGLVLLTLPLWGVLVYKAVRRRGRRRRPSAAGRVRGGWDEYVDAAVDAGLPRPGIRTRTEVAREYAGVGSDQLARWADEATFSDRPPSDAVAAEVWQLVERERRALRPGVWRRLGSALSWRSFARERGSR